MPNENRVHDREISNEELRKILGEHEIWLSSNGSEGQQADLRHIVDLKRGRLAGANLAGVIMPENLTWARERDYIEANVVIARPLYLILLIVCAYCVAVFFSTGDVNIISNSRISFIPEADFGVPVSSFFVAMPIGLLGFYIYLHLYLYRIWQTLGSFPSVFSDGTPLHRSVSPWLPVALVRFFQVHGVSSPTLVAQSQKWITIFLVWWMCPITLVMFWARYLVRHDWPATSLHLTLVAVAVWSAIVLHRLAVAAMYRQRSPFAGFSGTLAGLGMLIGFGTLFLGLSVATIETSHFDLARRGIAKSASNSLALIGVRSKAELAGADLSGANLSKADLRGANLSNSNLYNVNLSGADLRGAEISEANLATARLDFAVLRDASLWKADMGLTNLANANLQNANLINANLRRADLRSANLTGAKLTRAILTRALAGNSIFRLADLSDANLRDAILLRADLRSADLSRSQLGRANLFGSKLTDSDLLGSVLDGVNFQKAIGLTQDQLDRACGSDTRGLPSHLTVKPCPN